MWAEALHGRHPELRLLFAVPNGGQRTVAQAVWMKQEGLRKGVPDLCLPVPRVRDGHVCGSLFIEMKRKGGRLSAEQQQWQLALNANGALACVCYSYDEAVEAITAYLNLPKP